MEKFRVALSSDFMKPDGTPAFPSFDLTPLDDNSQLEWEYVPVRDGRIAAEDMSGFDALILLAAKFDSQSYPPGGQLALIARFGVGYDNVDIAEANKHGVAVAITPSGVRRPVAVAIITFILALSGRLLIKDRLTRQGPDGWAKRARHMGNGLVGATLGSVGIGNIGAELFRMAEPFGMSFIAHDPFADQAMADSLNVRLVELDELFSLSDYLCVNCPLTPETEKLVNAERLALMKPGAFVINTARGPIVDESALIDALRQGRIAGAGLDVFENEPTHQSNPLYEMENVLLTPHSLCWTDQCFANIGAADIEAVMAVMAGDVPDGLVNTSIVDNEKWTAKLARLSASPRG